MGGDAAIRLAPADSSRARSGSAALGYFVRFCAVGAFGFAFATALLYALLALGLGPYIGYGVAFIATVTATWWLNRSFTFADRTGSMIAQWARFVAGNAVAGIVNCATFAVLIASWESARAEPIIGTAAGALAGLAVNFVAARRYVFTGAR
jgi:putative flippase GtrA